MRHDDLTGELNRYHLTEILEKTLDEAVRFRSCCGFLLVAIDNLARINESDGFETADQMINAVGKRIRSLMRGKDTLGRFSGNKFGIVLKDCTPDDMAIAAERLLAGVRDDLVPTATGPVAATITIGGVTAPRHARTVAEILARAQQTLDAAKGKRRGSFFAYQPNIEREAQRRENVRATDEIVAALNERRIFVAYETVAATADRRPAFYECLMRVRRTDGSLLGAGDVIPVAERLGLVRYMLADFSASVGEALYRWDIESDVVVWSANAGMFCRSATSRRSPPAGLMRNSWSPTTYKRASIPSSNRSSATKAAASAITFNTASDPIPPRKPDFGSRTSAAGLPDRTASRPARTARCGSSTSATSANAGSTISPESVTSVAFSPDGKVLATGSADNSVRLWDVATGREIRVFGGHSAGINSVALLGINSIAFSPDGKTLASGGWDEAIEIWDLASGRLSRTLKGISGQVNSVAFAPNGKLLAAGDALKVKVWDVNSGRAVRSLSYDPVDNVPCVAFSADGRLAGVNSLGFVHLWDVASGRVLRDLDEGSGGRHVDRVLARWKDTGTRQPRRHHQALGCSKLARATVLRKYTNSISSVAFSPDGKALAAGGSGPANVWYGT